MSSSPLFLEPVAAAEEQDSPPGEAGWAHGDAGEGTSRVRRRAPRSAAQVQARNERQTPPGADEEEQPESTLPLMESPAEGVPDIIDTPEALEQAARLLDKSDAPVAVDTERAQGRTYGAGAYLVQIRREGAGTFLIDSHALPDLGVLREPLDAEWILHAADQDLVCMADLGVVPSALFDTEIAARLLGSERFGLGALTEEYLGIRLKKAHQNEDWSRRPLPQDWLSYAALDVELLAALRSVMLERLEQAGRLEWAQQEFRYELEHPNLPKPNHWRNLKGIGRLKRPAELAVARELWTTREQIAQETDTAPGRILTGTAILDAALMRPDSKRAMMRIGDFRRPLAKKNQDAWWSAIEGAVTMDPGLYPGRSASDPYAVPQAAQWKRSDPAAAERLTEVRELVAEAVEPLGIQPDVLLSARIQRELAWWRIDRDIPTPDNPKPKQRKIGSTAALIDAVDGRLQHAGARPWQRRVIRDHLEARAGQPGGSVLPLVGAAQPRPHRSRSFGAEQNGG